MNAYTPVVSTICWTLLPKLHSRQDKNNNNKKHVKCCWSTKSHLTSAQDYKTFFHSQLS